MTLTARREPLFHDGAHDGSDDDHRPRGYGDTYPSGASIPHAGSSASSLTRFVAMAQIAGSVLAIPLGLASGYSIYRANFSPETTCQNLRSNIIGMLDKSVDATTRRMLVRRDVESFEQNCGAVDPDAHAAFKRLLAAPAMAGAPALPPVRVISETADSAHKPVLRAEIKPETEPKTEPNTGPEAKAVARSEIKSDVKLDVKREAKAATKPDVKTAAREAVKPVNKETAKETAKATVAVQAASPDEIAATLNAGTVNAEAKAEPTPDARSGSLADARWLAAVRQALVAHDPELARSSASPQAANIEPVNLTPAPRSGAVEPVRAPRVILQPAWNVATPPVVPPTAPDLPVRASQGGFDHPVPPAPIPVIAPVSGGPLPPGPNEGLSQGMSQGMSQDAVERPDQPSAASRIGAWFGQLPLVGRVIEPRGN